MKRIAITRIEHKGQRYLAYIVLNEKREFMDLQVYEPEHASLLNHIYVGYVEKIVPNIHAAFVRIANGQKCYLPMNDLSHLIYAKRQSKNKVLCEGDEILVQVTRDAVKTKDPVVSTTLTLHGIHCVLTTADLSLGVSRKISDDRSQVLWDLLSAACTEHEELGYGMILRTNCEQAEEEAVRSDIRQTIEVYRNLLETGVYRRQGELLYRGIAGYLERLKTEDLSGIDVIYTDQEDVIDEVTNLLPELINSGKLKRYDDSAVSLSTLYHIRGNMEELLGRLVWLPSGANIIVETLETLTVIDVNSGRNQSKKEQTLFEINLEAAREVARQLRLRNLSGMIIVDFINMKSKEQQEQLIEVIKAELRKDHVPARFVDITKLGLVEITRKKVYKSLREVVS